MSTDILKMKYIIIFLFFSSREGCKRTAVDVGSQMPFRAYDFTDYILEEISKKNVYDCRNKSTQSTL